MSTVISLVALLGRGHSEVGHSRSFEAGHERVCLMWGHTAPCLAHAAFAEPAVGFASWREPRIRGFVRAAWPVASCRPSLLRWSLPRYLPGSLCAACALLIGCGIARRDGRQSEGRGWAETGARQPLPGVSCLEAPSRTGWFLSGRMQSQTDPVESSPGSRTAPVSRVFGLLHGSSSLR